MLVSEDVCKAWSRTRRDSEKRERRSYSPQDEWTISMAFSTPLMTFS